MAKKQGNDMGDMKAKERWNDKVRYESTKYKTIV